MASELAKCIAIVQSVPNETQIIINMISSEGTWLMYTVLLFSYNPFSFDIKDEMSDGILALLLSLETFINSFQFNWIFSCWVFRNC